MILIIDNYDSFTYNLYQYFGELGEELLVVRNDEISIDEIRKLHPDGIILSPGPGHPKQAGICVELIREFFASIPILGVCLGHQAIGVAFGAEIGKAEKIMHGKMSKLKHQSSSLFESITQNIDVMRYHSLIIKKDDFPDCLEVLGYSLDDQEIMGVKHRQYPVFGLQFHPESVGTPVGKQLLENFLNQIERRKKNENHSAATS
ncbi:anthranilate synthase component II [Cytobacillus gottheilii]|uniref:anthranilate synthase component II n=1 Tax=Cytobacillus gottheilii TaxID=859144 RepID=UPI0009BC270B|nr:aminodeoxychorismate/anthranilate synthase component II [Cytobacillus gottheilii]